MAESEQPGSAAAPSDAGSATQDMLRTFRAATEAVNGWVAGAAAFALLRAALEAGVLEAAWTPVSSAQLAGRAGLTEPLAEQFCVALEAHGVLLRDGEQYHLAPAIAYLLSPEALRSLPVLLDGERARIRALERLATPTPQAPPSPEDSLARARLSAHPIALAGPVGAVRAEVRAIWETGGRHCELGCGVGGYLLGLLTLFPRLTAVGVDLDARLLEEARRNAIQAGVADRVGWRHTDARELRDEAAFDTLTWSQFFFPRDSRAATLAVIYRALRPGGYLMLSVPPSVPTAAENLHTPDGRQHAILQLVFGCWGVDWLGHEELRAEIEGAGFTVIRHERDKGMLARRPLT